MGRILLGLSAIIINRLWRIQATKRKIEHMPNITVIGNASTCTNRQNNQSNTHIYTRWIYNDPAISNHMGRYTILKNNCFIKVDSVTYIVQHNTHKYVERNAEKVHDGAPGLLWNVLRSHLHNGRPKYAYTSFKSTEAKKLNATWEWDASTFLFGRSYQELININQVKIT